MSPGVVRAVGLRKVLRDVMVFKQRLVTSISFPYSRLIACVVPKVPQTHYKKLQSGLKLLVCGVDIEVQVMLVDLSGLPVREGLC